MGYIRRIALTRHAQDGKFGWSDVERQKWGQEVSPLNTKWCIEEAVNNICRVKCGAWYHWTSAKAGRLRCLSKKDISQLRRQCDIQLASKSLGLSTGADYFVNIQSWRYAKGVSAYWEEEWSKNHGKSKQSSVTRWRFLWIAGSSEHSCRSIVMNFRTMSACPAQKIAASLQCIVKKTIGNLCGWYHVGRGDILRT